MAAGAAVRAHRQRPAPRRGPHLRRAPRRGRRPWHSTQWTVDQAAALLLCSAEAAREHGIPLDRWVFRAVALESSFALSLSRRAGPHRWPAMGVLGETAAAHLGRPLALTRERLPTITGGMAFAGGPFNNFTHQATAAVVARLWDSGGLALVSTVSGLLTKPGLMVWSADPPAAPLLVADLAPEAEAATAAKGVVDAHAGPATVVAVTATYEGLDPARLVAVAETPAGARTVATSDDRDLAIRVTTEELVGTAVEVDRTSVVA